MMVKDVPRRERHLEMALTLLFLVISALALAAVPAFDPLGATAQIVGGLGGISLGLAGLSAFYWLRKP